jgi:hypothetical protein
MLTQTRRMGMMGKATPFAERQDVDGQSASSTASIASSIRKYRELHGRTYHNFNTETSAEYW